MERCPDAQDPEILPDNLAFPHPSESHTTHVWPGQEHALQNGPLWHKDYLRPKGNEKQQMFSKLLPPVHREGRKLITGAPQPPASRTRWHQRKPHDQLCSAWPLPTALCALAFPQLAPEMLKVLLLSLVTSVQTHCGLFRCATSQISAHHRQPHARTPPRVCDAPVDKLLCVLLPSLSFVSLFVPPDKGQKTEGCFPALHEPSSLGWEWKHKAGWVHGSATMRPGQVQRHQPLMGCVQRGCSDRAQEETRHPACSEAGTQGAVGQGAGKQGATPAARGRHARSSCSTAGAVENSQYHGHLI